MGGRRPWYVLGRGGPQGPGARQGDAQVILRGGPPGFLEGQINSPPRPGSSSNPLAMSISRFLAPLSLPAAALPPTGSTPWPCDTALGRKIREVWPAWACCPESEATGSRSQVGASLSISLSPSPRHPVRVGHSLQGPRDLLGFSQKVGVLSIGASGEPRNSQGSRWGGSVDRMPLHPHLATASSHFLGGTVMLFYSEGTHPPSHRYPGGGFALVGVVSDIPGPPQASHLPRPDCLPVSVQRG